MRKSARSLNALCPRASSHATDARSLRPGRTKSRGRIGEPQRNRTDGEADPAPELQSAHSVAGTQRSARGRGNHFERRTLGGDGVGRWPDDRLLPGPIRGIRQHDPTLAPPLLIARGGLAARLGIALMVLAVSLTRVYVRLVFWPCLAIEAAESSPRLHRAVLVHARNYVRTEETRQAPLGGLRDLLHLNGRDFTKRPLNDVARIPRRLKRALGRNSAVHDDKSVIVHQFARGCR